MLKELIFLGIASIGGYLTYGLFAEDMGSIIKNKRETGISIRTQLKILIKQKRKK